MIRTVSTAAKLKLIFLFSGMMFWYGIEQLFLNNVIQHPSARAWVTFSFFATLLIFDVPGGIFADKFGRKTALVTASTLMAISLIILGFSDALWVYVIGAIMYGVHWSFANGAAQALLYEHLVETKHKNDYAKHLGAMYAYGYVGATIGSLFSGVIANNLGLRAPYLLSVVSACFAIYLGLSLKESRFKDRHILASERGYHWSALYRTIRSTPLAVVFAAQIIITIVTLATIGEFGQIFILDFDVSAVQLGWIWAAVAVVTALVLHQAYRVQGRQKLALVTFILLLGAFAIVNSAFGIILFILVWAAVEVVRNISETDLQHVTASSSRATVLSSVNFAGNLVALPFILTFNYALQNYSIHAANGYMSIVLIVGSVFCVIGLYWHKTLR